MSLTLQEIHDGTKAVAVTPERFLDVDMPSSAWTLGIRSPIVWDGCLATFPMTSINVVETVLHAVEGGDNVRVVAVRVGELTWCVLISWIALLLLLGQLDKWPLCVEPL